MNTVNEYAKDANKSPKNDFKEGCALAYYEFKELVHSHQEAFGIQIEEPKV